MSNSVLIIRINNLGHLVSALLKSPCPSPHLDAFHRLFIVSRDSKFVKIGCIKTRYLIKPKTSSSFLKTFVIPKSQITLFILVLGGFNSSQHQAAGKGEERGWNVKTMCDANLFDQIWRNGFSHTWSGATQYILNCWLNRPAVSHKLKPSFFSGPISSQ